jgi:hypothetical protein
MNPELHLLADMNWQFFSTLTFKSLKVRESVWVKMFYAVMREQADSFGIHFYRMMWALRYELGEQTGRPHFHALIAGLPNSAVQTATCFSFMKIWEKHRGGNARVRVYNPTLAGVEYVLKGADEAYTNAGANWYELHKFGGACNVMLSKSLIRHLENRRRLGHRDRDGLVNSKQAGGIKDCDPLSPGLDQMSRGGRRRQRHAANGSKAIGQTVSSP